MKYSSRSLFAVVLEGESLARDLVYFYPDVPPCILLLPYCDSKEARTGTLTGEPVDLTITGLSNDALIVVVTVLVVTAL